MAQEMLKPVYLRNRELDNDRKKVATEYEILEAVSKCIDDTKCIQRDRDLWRIYVGSQASRLRLLTQGFDFRNSTVVAFDTNPFSAGINNPSEEVIKITVKGIPLSVDDTEIVKMLEKFDVSFTSPLKYQNIRHPVTRKITGILNGNRFIYAKPLPNGKFLPRTSYCAGLKCFIYHKGQPPLKRKPFCTNCKVCLKEGHEPGSQLCPHYVDKSDGVLSINGKNNVLSKFFPCNLEVFGTKHRSAEHAYQYVKAVRCVDLPRAAQIQEAESALSAKRIGNEIVTFESFQEEKTEIMTEIIEAKEKQVKEFSDELKQKNALFVDSVYDNFWGTGLDAVGTQHTDPEKWPVKNILDNMLQKVANKVRKSQHQWTKVKSAKAKSGQLDISHMLVRKHGKRSRDKRRSKDQSSSRENSPRKRSKSVHRKRATRRDSRSRDESSSTSSESACETEQ